ncbi:MAG: lysozyme inhibitor LprI family protein [Flavobacteriales bacterium]
MIRILLGLFLLLGKSMIAQVDSNDIKLKKIDMAVVRQTRNLLGKIECPPEDSFRTIMQQRVCLNLLLQKEDSLLQKVYHYILDTLFSNSDTIKVEKFKLTQENWELHRYAWCDTFFSEDQSTHDLLFFLACAVETTRRRKEELLMLKMYIEEGYF